VLAQSDLLKAPAMGHPGRLWRFVEPNTGFVPATAAILTAIDRGRRKYVRDVADATPPQNITSLLMRPRTFPAGSAT
jgi:hypothetical protein